MEPVAWFTETKFIQQLRAQTLRVLSSKMFYTFTWQKKKMRISFRFQELQGFFKELKKPKRSKMSAVVASQIQTARWALMWHTDICSRVQASQV